VNSKPVGAAPAIECRYIISHMPARTKGRARFGFRGRKFLWWVDGDRYLRITSLDKKFTIAYAMEPGQPAVVEVRGPEFPGIEASERRPLRFAAPVLPTTSMGAWVHCLLSWSFDTSQKRERVEGH
jgi:hypothetical protein